MRGEVARLPPRHHLGGVHAVPATVSAVPFVHQVTALAGLGVDAERVLGIAGISRASIEGPHARLPIDALFRFWDAAIHVSGDPAIGLRIGATIHPGALGGFEYLLRHSETLRKVLDRAERYVRLVDDLGHVEVVETGGVAALRVSRRGGIPNAHSEV
jgi:hypothetical protein